jgi:hypothetical protein
MPRHRLVATLVHDGGGTRNYVLGLAGHPSVTVRIDSNGDMHLLNRCGWAELGSSLHVTGGTVEHLARAASMAYAVTGTLDVEIVDGIDCDVSMSPSCDEQALPSAPSSP